MSAWSNSTDVRSSVRGVVVEELRRLVEEDGVVLVALDDEVLARRPRGSSPSKFAGDAADEERRIAPGLVQERRERGSSSWSCRACRPRRPSGARGSRARRARRGTSSRAGRRSSAARASGLSGRTAFPITTRSGRRSSTCSASKPSATGMPQPRERRAHRRVDAGVGARHLVAARLQQPGERAHPGPGDGDEVDVHVAQAAKASGSGRGRSGAARTCCASRRGARGS